MQINRSFAAVLTCSLFLISTSGCRQLRNPTGLRPATSAQLSATQFHINGIVLGKSPVSNQVTIEEAAVPGTMPAIMAVYGVPDSNTFRKLQPGDTLSADALLSADDSVHILKNIAVTSEPRNPDQLSNLPPHPLLAGETVPRIPMVNQDGKTTALHDFQGKAILVTFVDTQCTDDCPIISKLFASIDHVLAQNSTLYSRSDLITVSLDPAHDTPSVLRKYGLQYLDGNAAGFSHWQFVDLTPKNLKRLATSFGVVYMPSHDDIIHTIEISLISPSGRLLQSWDGDHWDPNVIAEAVGAAIAQTKS